MIAVDSSALIAIAWREPGYEGLQGLIARNQCILTAANLLETHMVLAGRGNVDPAVFINALTVDPLVEVVPLGLEHFLAARTAFDRFGKGRGHPAQLNFGDCLSYAMAKVAGAPLLFKGDDFRHTDIEPALRA